MTQGRRRFLLFIIVLSAATTVLFGWRSYGSFLFLRSAYEAGRPDVSSLRPWMTLDHISATYRVPIDTLRSRLDFANHAIVLDTLGRAYTIRASDIPGGRGDGVPVTTLIDLPPGAKIAQAVSGRPEQKYLVAGTGGRRKPVSKSARNELSASTSDRWCQAIVCASRNLGAGSRRGSLTNPEVR
jgi:hypothetical protein